MKKLIYVAGKYRGANENEVYENIQKARQMAIRLWQEGWVVFCPHLNTAFFGGCCNDEVWLEGDLEILKRCDAVCMMKGWEESRGAAREWKLAQSMGKKIVYEI